MDDNDNEDWTKVLEEWGREEGLLPPLPEPRANGQAENLTPDIEDPRTAGAYRAAFARARENIIAGRSARRSGRNNVLNEEACNLYQLAVLTHHTMTDDELEDWLYDVACEAGLDTDANCGPIQIRNTIHSGFKGGARYGPRTNVPKSDDQVADVIDFHSRNGSKNRNSDDTYRFGDNLEDDVAKQAYYLRVQEDGRALFNTQRAERLGQQEPEVIMLPDLLAVPDDPLKFRIGELLPTGARALLAAPRKAGKTSMVGNLLRSLADGDLFLDQFEVEP